jgi:hypothetical protein
LLVFVILKLRFKMTTLSNVSTKPVQDNTQIVPASNKETWGSWILKGTTSAISCAAGFQARGIVHAWIPKLIIDASIAKSGYILGGLMYGPAAVEAAQGVIGLAAAGAGIVATGVTGAAIVGAVKAGGLAIDVIGEKLEQRNLKNGQRTAQMESKGKASDIMAVDDWNELIAEEALLHETDFDERLKLRSIIAAQRNNKAIQQFRSAIKV